MWGIPVSVSKDNRKATLVMKHALAAVRITYVRGTYSGTGNVSKVSFGGNCIAVAGTLDATDGSISNLAGKGTMLTPPQITTTLSSTLQEFELIVILPERSRERSSSPLTAKTTLSSSGTSTFVRDR